MNKTTNTRTTLAKRYKVVSLDATGKPDPNTVLLSGFKSQREAQRAADDAYYLDYAVLETVEEVTL